MKPKLTSTFLLLLLVSLLIGCSKKHDVGPTGPIVGKWDISRYTVSGLPTSYSALNGTISTDLTPDTYVFRNDGSYTNTQVFQATPTTTSTTTEVGKWLLTGTTVTLTPNGQTSSYILLYSASANELTTGPFSASETLDNPTTGVSETISYTLEYIYKKTS